MSWDQLQEGHTRIPLPGKRLGLRPLLWAELGVLGRGSTLPGGGGVTQTPGGAQTSRLSHSDATQQGGVEGIGIPGWVPRLEMQHPQPSSTWTHPPGALR